MKNKYIVFTAMGFELIGLMAVALYIGKIIDDTYLLKGLGLIGFSLLALSGWLIHIILLSKKIDSSENNKNE